MNNNHNCDYDRAEFEDFKANIEEQFDEYLHLDEADDYINDLIDKKLEEFKFSENAISKTHYTRLETLARDLTSSLQTSLESEIQGLSKNTECHFNT